MPGQYRGPIVDVDIHHQWKRPDEIIAYLPREWQTYVDENRGMKWLSPPSAALGKSLANGARMADSYPKDGSPPGSDYETLREQWLDKYPITHGVLTFDVGDNGTQTNQFFAEALCSAINEWNIETWLDKDQRLYSGLVVPIGDPAAAAKEVRRIGEHGRICGVVIAGNVLLRPLGDPIYDPIYEAAEDLDLVVMVHPTANGHRRNLRSLVAGGNPASTVVNASQFSQQAMHYISSFITHGTFERFPRLRILVQEYGVAWLPWLLWKLDENYESMKVESTWVKKWPSEYVFEHIKIATQPLEESDEPKGLQRLLESYGELGDLLCFSSDYPHLTADEPGYVARALPSEWGEAVFCTNALKLFGWESDAVLVGAHERTNGVG